MGPSPFLLSRTAKPRPRNGADGEPRERRDFGAQITPFASRTFQFTKEQFGQADDKAGAFPSRTTASRGNPLTGFRKQTQLPPDYMDLEKRVDALKQAHQKMLAVT